MKTFILLASLILSVTQAFAQNDPYAPMNYFEEGPFKGQLINNKDRRSIKIVEETSESFTVANFTHDKKYYLAIIPKNAVRDIIVHIDYFTSSIPAAHSQLRLILNHPILLRDQITNEVRTTLISDIVFSIEAIKGPSSPYGLIQGMQKHFAVSYRFMSTQDKYRTLICDDKERTTQYNLTMSPEQKNQFLENALRLSDKSDNKTMYHTWKVNCTTEMIRLLDSVLDRSLWTNIKSAGTTVGAHYPVFVRSSLRARKILGLELPEFKDDTTVGLTPKDCK